MNPLFQDLPGAELISEGLADLGAQRETTAALLVQIGKPRLALLQVDVPVSTEIALEADRRLYRLLALEHGDGAHSQYNSLIRRLVSFERALDQRLSGLRKAREAGGSLG